jgi:Na+-translocating ferredoxin:NAD+ oxidoreductase RnfD subunit
LILGFTGPEMADAIPELLGATLTAMVIDLPILRWREKKWVFPSGALLTGLIIGMVLSQVEPWYVASITAAVAILSKYVLRVGDVNVFNPAALALVATFFVFDTEQSWWGALPEISPWALIALFSAGVFIADRLNKMPAVLAFLGVYYTLITARAFIADPAPVAELFRAPDLHAAIYFAFFMVTDPPTSPPKRREQWIFGAIVAAVSYGFFELVGGVYFLLVGLLVANVWESWRRGQLKARRVRRTAIA